MYKIIGGDGQEYGPVSEADLCKWIAEGRLNEQSLAKAESDANFRPLSTFPEFAGALGRTACGAATPPMPNVDWSTRDYNLDIGGCISRGWHLFTENLGILFGSSALCLFLLVVVLLVISVVAGVVANTFPIETRVSPTFLILQSCVINIVMSLVIGPLIGGLCHIFIQTLRGQTAGVGCLFIGFQKAYPQLIIGCVVFTLAYAFCFFPATIFQMSQLTPVLAISEQARHGGATPEQMQEIFPKMISAFTSSIPVFLACLVPWSYLFTNFLFIFPLIIDRDMNFWTAIKTSWRMLHKHWFTVFGLIFLIGLINFAGLCLCCLPVFFTFAFTTAACMVAYETIFGGPRPV
jgi:hypothetical protein